MKNRLKLLVSALLILASLALSGCGDTTPAPPASAGNLQLVQTTFKTSRAIPMPGYSSSRFLVLKDGVVFDVTTSGSVSEPKITSVVVLLEP
jgi:hypothetical protein